MPAGATARVDVGCATLANVRRAPGVSIGDNLKADAGRGGPIVAGEAEGARCYGH